MDTQSDDFEFAKGKVYPGWRKSPPYFRLTNGGIAKQLQMPTGANTGNGQSVLVRHDPIA